MRNSYNIVQVIAHHLQAGRDITDEFDSLYFFETENELFGSISGGCELQISATGYECKAIGDWPGEPEWSAWDNEVAMAGLDDFMQEYRDIVRAKAAELFAKEPNAGVVTFLLVATQRFYWDEDGGDSEWLDGTCYEMDELIKRLKA